VKEDTLTSAIKLLKQLIAIPSFSKEEEHTAVLLFKFLKSQDINVHRKGNNVWATNKFFDLQKPTLLLNSHHDTVKPNAGYTRNPFNASEEEGKIFGLGSNDAGASLVSLLFTFLHFYKEKNLSFNIILALTAEEEISGKGGIEFLWNDLPTIDCAIVGEPTSMQVAIVEKGLLVLDCTAKGRAGHAAREEGVNAIYQALPDVQWFQHFQFQKISETLGKVKMSVTSIHAGQAHNQVPPECNFVVDIRVTDSYTLEEVLSIIKNNVNCEVVPRSIRIRPSCIALSHPLVQAASTLGYQFYGSPTTSDQALIPVPSIKLGPGDSARSHSADEFVYVDEVKKGIEGYIQLIETVWHQNLFSK
jgi:acetylornithine deacetylase